MRTLLAICLLALAAPALAQQAPGLLTVIHPCRLLDTRLPAGSPPRTANTTYQIAVRRSQEELDEGACGVPEEANSVFMTVTAVGATGEGYVKIWASDLLAPVAPAFTFRGNGADSSATFSRLCAPPLLECSGVDLSFQVLINNSHVIMDLVGYTTPWPE